ncbi:MAG TPA: copper resistance protein NlpE N-terminal domain-containing protein [Pontibacter sp.]
MRKVFTCLWLYTVVGLSACTTSEIQTEPVDVAAGESRLPSSLVGTWRGIIPCADCPGINYNLSLNEDNTYEETMVYQERDADPFTRTGNWRITNGVLQLMGPDSAHTQFDLSTGGELSMLDQTGQRITGNLANMYILHKDTGLADDNSELWNEKRRLGVDFVATGNEPGWALEIDLEKGLFFRTLPTETISLDTPISAPEKKGKTTTYRGTATGGELVVELTEQDCKDSMSGKASPYTVRVTAKGVQFNGCGMYLGERQQEEQ